VNAKEAFDLFVKLPIKGTILDIGSNNKRAHTNKFREKGFKVITVDPHYDADIQEHWPCCELPEVDHIWCSHTLEHSRNPGKFLDAIYKTLPEKGWLAITVPPMKQYIVGGHVTLWNAGLLLYNLILSGFNCKQAKVKTYNYNVSVIVQKRPARLPVLTNNFKDITSLAKFFPCEVFQDFDGNISEINWE